MPQRTNRHHIVPRSAAEGRRHCATWCACWASSKPRRSRSSLVSLSLCCCIHSSVVSGAGRTCTLGDQKAGQQRQCLLQTPQPPMCRSLRSLLHHLGQRRHRHQRRHQCHQCHQCVRRRRRRRPSWGRGSEGSTNRLPVLWIEVERGRADGSHDCS